MKKKVLLISLTNEGGGASKIVSELFSELLKNKNLVVELLIQEGISQKNIISMNSSLLVKTFFRLKNKIVNIFIVIFGQNKLNYQSINVFPSNLLQRINNSNADIVHLHWIGAEMINIYQIGKINKKIIWTLHDSWPLNGSCHINPNEYKNDYINVNSKLEKPISILDQFTLNRKIKYLSNKNIIFTAPSRWIKEKYEKSFYNKNTTKCYLIPNFIDISIWKNFDKSIAKKYLKIDTNKKLIIYGAGNINKSFNKGFHFIQDICNLLNPNEYALIIFGKSDEKLLIDNKFEVFQYKEIKNQEMLIFLYSAGDVTIVPSYSESFSMISLESIACNTPVVAFDTSGIKDIVIHKKNGYLAEKFETTDLVNGILWVSMNPMIEIRNSILKFSKDKIIPKYCNLYNNL